MLEVTSPQLIVAPTELPDLAPDIHRQRMVIEGLIDQVVDEHQIVDYLTLVGYHTQAGSINTGDSGTTISQQNWFAMQYLGA